MSEQTRERVVIREYLCNGRSNKPRKAIDMEAVYKDIDGGMSLTAVAKKYKVSKTTLQRRHEEYQAMLKKKMDEAEETGYELPPLPPGI